MNNASNMVKRNKMIKEKTINKEKKLLKIQKIINQMTFLIPFIVFSFFIYALVCLYHQRDIPEIAATVDFVIACTAIFVLFVSNLKYRGIFKKKKFLWYSTVYILLMTIGLIIFMVVGISLRKAGEVARFLSLVGLVVTILIELIDATKTDYEFYRKCESKQEYRIKKEEQESAMSFS